MVIGRVAGRYTQAFFFWAVSVFFTFLMGSKGPHSTHLRRGSEDPRGAAGGWCGFFKRSVGGGGGGVCLGSATPVGEMKLGTGGFWLRGHAR